MRPMHDNICFRGIDLDSLMKGDMQDKVMPPVACSILAWAFVPRSYT